MMNDLNNWEIFGLGWLVLAVITFICLFFLKITPPYGRHARSDWGPMINNTFGWIFMEAPSLIFLWLSFAIFSGPETPEIAFLPLALWSIHYTNRTFIFPFRFKNKKKQIPLIIVASGIFFNIVNSGLNGLFLAKGWFMKSDILMVIGCLVFFAGMVINIKSDHILIGLRKPGEMGYKLPRGFLFDRVTSPNLFGEIIEWLGFFILAPSIASFGFWIWTMANLVPRARDHHKWYLQKFDEYPKNRKVLIPGIW